MILSSAARLLQEDATLFLGDCEWSLRNISKIVKTLLYKEQNAISLLETFEFGKSLTLWMIELCNNMDQSRV